MAALLENILLGKEYLAIEFFHSDRKEKIAFLKVRKKRNELIIVQKEIFENPGDLSVNKSKSPATLIINNEQVLIKEVESKDPGDKKLLHMAFPGLQADDFYYEIWRRGQTSVIAICRKAYVNELLAKLEDTFGIAAINLGFQGVASLSGFDLPVSLSTNTQRLFTGADENMFVTENSVGGDYEINGLQVPNTHLLGFCGILRFILPISSTGSLTDLDTTLNDKFRQAAFFAKGIKAAIVIFLTLLLINFFVFTYYFDKAGEMTETVSLHKAGIENITKIKQRVKEKQQRLESFTDNAASASSLIINDLVKNTPSAILLSEVSYHPLEKKIKDDEPVQVTDKLIVISGATLSNTAFTAWVEEIGASKWVSNVTISSFGKDTENNTKFSISIILKK